MASKKKDNYKRENERKKIKKPYQTPLMTVHGTLEKITEGPSGRNREAQGRRS